MWDLRQEKPGSLIRYQSHFLVLFNKAGYSQTLGTVVRLVNNNQMSKFALYRILGNDLPPRHGTGQTLGNLEFILEHESSLPDCEKRWVVNRIADLDQERQIISLLDRHGQKYIHIPFELDEYAEHHYDIDGLPGQFYLHCANDPHALPILRARALEYPFRYKNLYAMNNNGARNAALEEGRTLAEWVMPWDGNCFVTMSAWNSIVQDVASLHDEKYLIVPMMRVHDNSDLLREDFVPGALEEPQIAFHRLSHEKFDNSKRYGFNPKVDLLRRLKVPGPWERWPDVPWEKGVFRLSDEAGKFRNSGWVARLSSGAAESENVQNKRYLARINGIIRMLSSLDERVLRTRFRHEDLIFYDESVLSASRLAWGNNQPNASSAIDELIATAQSLLGAGPYSVTKKTSMPPSGDKHDYLNPAPYWWKDPDQAGVTAEMHDGKRLQENELYSPESNKYDRTRLQLLFDQTMILALAWYFSDEKKYAEHAAFLIRTWFLDPATRMNPHLKYAQIRLGEKDEQLGYGIIETKDLYFFLDAVRLVSRSGKLSHSEQEQFRQWCREFLAWLLNSSQGRRVFMAQNNQGTYYDLQVASLAAFLDDAQTLLQILRISCMRAAQQFLPDGRQPEELKRTNSLHYSVFNLQGWFNLSRIARKADMGLWNSAVTGAGCPSVGLVWMLHLSQGEWPYQQLDEFDYERLALLDYCAGRDDLSADAHSLGMHKTKAEIRNLFHPYAGVQPFWSLGIE